MNLSLRRIKQLERGELTALLKKRIWNLKAKAFSKRPEALTSRREKINRLRRKVQGPQPDFLNIGSFYFSTDEGKTIRDIYDRHFAEEKELIFIEAEKYYRKKFNIFGVNLQFENKINWHLDPISGQEWPRDFYNHIPFRGEGRIGDVKYPWELNRHQHLVTLGQAYYINQDERFANEIVSEITSWIADNPPFIGINWISALEIGIRLINWIWSLRLIKDSRAFHKDFINDLLCSVKLQIEHLCNNLTILPSIRGH